MNEIIIVKAKAEDVDDIRLISDMELGAGYSRALFENINIRQNHILGVAKYNQNQIVGFCFGSLIEKDVLKQKWNLIPKENSINKYWGYAQTIVVKAEFQNKGIGGLLIEFLLQYFKNNQIDKVYTTAWKTKGLINANDLLNKYHFQLLKEIPNYWYLESLQHQYLCPVCVNPCNCTALIYERDL